MPLQEHEASGKSTMVLQYLKSRISDSKVLYISADHTYFSTHKLVEVADEFSKEDGKLLVIDEVHKYPEWSRDLKQKKMLAVISILAPYKPNADSLASEIGISRNSVQDYLALLERAQLIGQLRDDTGGMRGLGKVEKVYIDNPSLMNALSGGKTDVGNMRETYFYNQMRVRNDVKDDIEFAQGNVIPLWAFGLNY